MVRGLITRDSDGSTIDLDKEEAEHADTTANAKRITIVDSTGSAIASDNRFPVDTELTLSGNVIVDKVRISGTTDGTTFLPIKVASDGGDPALGKLVCSVG